MTPHTSLHVIYLLWYTQYSEHGTGHFDDVITGDLTTLETVSRWFFSQNNMLNNILKYDAGFIKGTFWALYDHKGSDFIPTRITFFYTIKHI